MSGAGMAAACERIPEHLPAGCSRLHPAAQHSTPHLTTVCHNVHCREDAQVLLARLMSGYGRDASLNAYERKTPGTVAVAQLPPGSPSAAQRSPRIFGAAYDGERQKAAACWWSGGGLQARTQPGCVGVQRSIPTECCTEQQGAACIAQQHHFWSAATPPYGQPCHQTPSTGACKGHSHARRLTLDSHLCPAPRPALLQTSRARPTAGAATAALSRAMWSSWTARRQTARPMAATAAATATACAAASGTTTALRGGSQWQPAAWRTR